MCGSSLICNNVYAARHASDTQCKHQIVTDQAGNLVKYRLDCAEISSVIVLVRGGVGYRIGKSGCAEIPYRIGSAACAADWKMSLSALACVIVWNRYRLPFGHDVGVNCFGSLNSKQKRPCSCAPQFDMAMIAAGLNTKKAHH